MSSPPVRIGIVGCGSVSHAYGAQLQVLQQRGEAVVVAACDILEEKRSMVRETWGVSDFTTDYRELVGNNNVDLVLVITSMPAHGPITKAALEAGKHVLVEKPMAITLEEAREILALAQRSPGLLLCAPHIILSPTYRAMWKHIRQGDIGKPLMARARYGHGGPNWGPWFYQEGGGALFDLGVYNLTALTGWIGPVRRVTAMAGTAVPDRFVDGQWMRATAEDNAHVLLDFGDSVFAVVTTGFTIQRYRGPSLEVYGSDGTIQMMGDDWAPNGYEIWQNKVGAWQIREETAPNWRWTEGLEHLVESIRQKTPLLITPEHAFHVLEIMIRAQEASKDGQTKEIESVFPPLALSPEAAASPAVWHDPRR